MNPSGHGATISRYSEILQAVERASKRSAAVVHQEMSHRVDGLATIASVAPWIGVLGTSVGIVSSFRGFDGEKSAMMAALAARLSESVWPTAMGILVGLAAFFCYRYLTGRLETIDAEMDSASLALLNQLSRSPGRFAPGCTTTMFDGGLWAELDHDQQPFRHLGKLTASALALAWFIQVIFCFYHELLPLHVAVGAACSHLLFKFGVSCLLAFPVWTKLLNPRRPGCVAVLAALGSAVCLCWSIAELLLVVKFR